MPANASTSAMRARVDVPLLVQRKRVQRLLPTTAVGQIIHLSRRRVPEYAHKSFRRFAAHPQEWWVELHANLDQEFRLLQRSKQPCRGRDTCTTPGVRTRATKAIQTARYRV